MDIGESLSAYLQADFKITHSKVFVNIFFDILLKIVIFLRRSTKMTKKNGSTIFKCSTCGYSQPRWLGRCPECGEWNSFEEIIIDNNRITPAGRGNAETEKAKPVDLSTVKAR